MSRFEVGFSAIRYTLLLVFHLLAIVSILLTPLPGWAAASIAALISLSFFHHAARQARSFVLDGKRVLWLHADGRELQGGLICQTVVTPLCVVLCVKMDTGSFCQPIFCDAMQKDEFRRLRVRLKTL